MESLALLVALLLAALYLSSLLALGLSFVDHVVARVVTWAAAAVAIAYGLWLAISLGHLGAIVTGLLPAALGGVGIWNSLRVRRKGLARRAAARDLASP